MEKTVNDKFVQWFEGPANPSDPSDKTLNYERIGYLVACNRGHFKVSQMGIIAMGSPFNTGLTSDEGMELI